jgi:DNA polymerase-3 subunit beta
MATATLEGAFNVSSPRKDLFDGIQVVGKAVATRSSLPILTHVRLAVSGGRVSLMATDLELWMEHTLPGQVIAEDGAATAPAKNFTELLGAMPDAEVTFSAEADTNAISLRCNRANYKLLGLPADEFPLLPEVPGETQFTIDRSILRDAIRQTLFATSSDETRIILTGMLLVFQGDTLRFVATDTHRLTMKDAIVKEAGEGAQPSASAIVPSRVMNEVLRILGNSDGDVSIVLGGNQIKFEMEHDRGGHTTLISRLIDGQFPNYERVIPKEPTRTLTIRRDDLSAAVKRAAIVARENNNRIVLRSSDDAEKVTITAESGSVGNAYEEVEVAREGVDSPVEIAFNAKYLTDVLNVLECEGINLELTEALRPGVIKMSGNASYLCVLMPMQVV